MVDKSKLEDVMMSSAFAFAELSRANRKKVGALLVQGSNIISYGFNGTPSGFNNTCEDIHGKTLPEVLHAESNVITKVAKSTETTEGSTLYCTLSPCFDCAKLIIQAGIVEVIYKEQYHNTAGINLLEKAAVKVRQL